MNIAVQAADLDAARIDGTRVYLLELLKRFGTLSPETSFDIFHRRTFNPELAPPDASNYSVKKVSSPAFWMQTRFPLELFRSKPDKVFFPVQAVPFVMPRDVEVIATIHDLAFRHFPETFPAKDRLKLNLLLDRAVARADKLIAVSESTKRDLLSFYPHLDPKKIRVIHHGFDAGLFGQKLSEKELNQKLTSYKLQATSYLLYVGALQPRKNLVRLVQAFERMKRSLMSHPGHDPGSGFRVKPGMTNERGITNPKLVLVGEEAWLSKPILETIQKSEFRDDIILTGKVPFNDLPALYQSARVFAFPSLFEGFGIPILEAFASGVPVLTANNSSLPEVAGDAALFCDAENVEDMADKLSQLWGDDVLRQALIEKGVKRLTRFSWERCAKETIEYILE